MSMFRVQIGVASRPMPGEVDCGDQVAVVRDASRSLIAVVDGVGHGTEAATVARAAIAAIVVEPWARLEDVIDRCARALAQTRGAAITLLRFDAATGELEHVGVGNVEVACSTRQSARFVAVPGIMGVRVRKVLVTSQRVHPGDLFVVHTDGVSRRLDFGRYFDLDPTSLANKLVEQYGSPRDDAACVVLRC
jgi:negative regulator of sigma-B (phosphoserine phosphatase)